MPKKNEKAGCASILLEQRKYFPEKSMIFLKQERRDGAYMLDPERELNMLGLSPRLIGYWDLLAAINVVAQDKASLTAMIQEVYTPAAARRSVEWDCVESSIRKAILTIWRRGNRARLEQIMHRRLPEPPTAGEFLGAFVFHLEGVEKESDALLH